MHIIFDLDGTLIDSEEGIRTALTSAMRDCDIARQIPHLARYIGPPIDVLVGTIWPDISDEDTKAVSKSFRTHYDMVHCATAPLYPGVREAIHGLAEDQHVLYIATNKPAKPTALILDRLRINESFSGILCIDSIDGRRFPNKATMLNALQQQHAITQCDGIYVGDTLADREAAMTVNLPFLAAGYGFGGLVRSPHDGEFAASPSDLHLSIQRYLHVRRQIVNPPMHRCH